MEQSSFGTFAGVMAMEREFWKVLDWPECSGQKVTRGISSHNYWAELVTCPPPTPNHKGPESLACAQKKKRVRIFGSQH